VNFEKIKEAINYDPETGEFTWSIPPKCHPNLLGKPCGVWIPNRSKEYLVIQIFGKKYRAHRLAWMIVYGAIPEVVDHIDGNTKNNAISNLRNVTCLENSQNHLKHQLPTERKKSGLPAGVKLLKSGMFQARITIGKRQIALGSYPTAQKAHEVYMEKRRKYHDCPTIK